MSGWLAVAEKLFGRPAGELPSAYQIECACGRKVSGARGDRVHISYCAACGTALVVLPKSVYPRPRGLSVEAAVPAQPASRSPRRRTAKRAQDHAPGRSKSEPAAEQAPRPPVRDDPPSTRRDLPNRIPQIDAPRLRRKILSPVRVVLLGVALVSGLTVWWSARVRERNDAERTLSAAVRQAQQALDEHDLGEAAQRYQEIRQALNTLGRSDSRANELRQTAVEIIASANLARSSLFDILEEAMATMARSGSAMWTDTFRSSYRDEWVLIDAVVTRAAEPSARERFEIDFPLSSGTDRAVIVGDLTCFERAVPGGSPRRVIFAAQIAEFTHAPADQAAWRVVLRPATAFLWTASDNLERLGVEIDDGTKQVLAEQSALLGVYQ